MNEPLLTFTEAQKQLCLNGDELISKLCNLRDTPTVISASRLRFWRAIARIQPKYITSDIILLINISTAITEINILLR